MRRTAAARLYESEVDDQLITEVTGQRSKAVRSYKRTSIVLQEMVSDILQRRQGLGSRQDDEPEQKRTKYRQDGDLAALKVGHLSCTGGGVTVDIYQQPKEV